MNYHVSVHIYKFVTLKVGKNSVVESFAHFEKLPLRDNLLKDDAISRCVRHSCPKSSFISILTLTNLALFLVYCLLLNFNSSFYI